MALFEDVAVGSPGSCKVKKFDGPWGGRGVWGSLGCFKAKLLRGLGLLRVQMSRTDVLKHENVLERTEALEFGGYW